MTHPSGQVRTYFVVFASLLALTLLTVLASHLEVGGWHTPLALTIAAVKATLVVLFFMHLLHSTRLTWVVVLGSLFWLAIMIGLTMSDYLSRPWLRT